MTIASITTGALNGTGYFDSLMVAMDAHLREQFKQGRINQVDYAQVYSAAITQTMSLAIQYSVTEQQAALLAEQVLVEKEKVLIEKQKLIAAENQALISAQQVLLITEQVANATKEGLLLDEQVLLTAQKVISETAQTDGTVTNESSILGRKAAVLKAQTDGFQRDAEQKATRIMSDIFNVAHSQAPTEHPIIDVLGGMNYPHLTAVMTALKDGATT